MVGITGQQGRFTLVAYAFIQIPTTCPCQWQRASGFGQKTGFSRISAQDLKNLHAQVLRACRATMSVVVGAAP